MILKNVQNVQNVRNIQKVQIMQNAQNVLHVQNVQNEVNAKRISQKYSTLEENACMCVTMSVQKGAASLHICREE